MAHQFKPILSVLAVVIACAAIHAQYLEQSNDYHVEEEYHIEDEYHGGEQYPIENDYHGGDEYQGEIEYHDADEYQSEVEILELTPQGKRVYDEYTLGEREDGTQIIYSCQHTQSFENFQDEISLTFDYPSGALDSLYTTTQESEYLEASDGGTTQSYVTEIMENSFTITQVTAFLEATDGAATQAYVTANGIGERSISMQMVAQNSSSLHYMIVLYGKQF